VSKPIWQQAGISAALATAAGQDKIRALLGNFHSQGS
jgi:hypothetical protein